MAERQRTEDELRRLSRAVEQAADAVMITDREGCIEYVNPAFEQLTGYSQPEAIRRMPSFLDSGQHDQSFYKTLWKTIRAGQTFRSTLINRKKDGALFYAETAITPVKDG